jgi:colanic acid/amylovoran biosynthesis glycosyltransferase
MNVLYVVEKYPSNTEYFIHNEIEELVKKGFSISVLALRKETAVDETKLRVFYKTFFDQLVGHFYLILKKPALYFECLKKLIGKSSLNIPLLKNLKYFSIAAGFYYQTRSVGYHHIHAHFSNLPATLADILANLSGKRFSFTGHAHDIYCTNKAELADKLGKALFAVTCTKFNKDFMTGQNGLLAQKLHVVYHGIDIDKWAFKERKSLGDHIKILFVGRLVEKKGAIYLVRAIRQLVEKGIKVQCTIIGGGPELGSLQAFVNENGLNKNIRFTSFLRQEEIRSYFYESDLFVLPCCIDSQGDRDGIPNVIAEAMATGVPVITTSVSGIPELIEDRETGIVVQERAPEQIVEKIISLIANPGLYNQLSVRGREKIETDFWIRKSTEQLIDIFSTINE